MNFDEVLNTFVAESRELLENMEAALLQIEQAPDDADLINAIFRAAHTIKGSAGLFGQDHLVAFTHNAENVLDRVRGGHLAISGELVALFLDICDHIGTLVEHVAQGSTPSAEALARSADLILRLQASAGDSCQVSALPPQPQPPASPSEHEAAGDGVASGNWHISLRFNPDVLKNGLDPLSFIRYLTTFGQIVSIVTLTDSLPRASEMDPESCYLGFEIAYRSEAKRATIEGAFDFVRDDARISVLPPHSRLDDYLELIRSRPEAPTRLGEILVRCGTLTRSELDGAPDFAAAPNLPPAAAAAAPIPNGGRPPPPETPRPPAKPAKESRSGDASLIRVNAEKLDEHINLIGELIIASAGINLAALKSGQAELLEAASLLNRLVENVRDSALQLRMVQIGATFNKFQRVVRDVAKEIGKDIHLEISGAETELDKTVVEKIGDPLTHLVRNSMDHGIEPAEIRLARGKPAHGTLRLNAYHDSGSIVIEVSDDGGGLNKARILAKAMERGLVKPEQVLSDSEIYALIFEPGFSTAEQVNNLSGRGVGMDVVRRNIVALRGSVDIESEEGVGATMRIRLPLTLAIIDGFLVGVGGSSFVVPLEMVVECVELTAAEIAAAQGRDQLNLRGEVLPFIRLRELFDIPEPPPPVRTEAEEALLQNVDEELAYLLQPVRRENVVVVNYAGHRAGLVVDDLQGEYQTVIRPLGAVFTGLQGISGFTILGSGLVALILDVPGLVRRVARNEALRDQPLRAVLD